MKPDRISSPIDSFESKWWYRLPDRIPAASAISRTVVARKPFSAKRRPASRTRCARRSDGSAAFFEVVTCPIMGRPGQLPKRLLGQSAPDSVEHVLNLEG